MELPRKPRCGDTDMTSQGGGTGIIKRVWLQGSVPVPHPVLVCNYRGNVVFQGGVFKLSGDRRSEPYAFPRFPGVVPGQNSGGDKGARLEISALEWGWGYSG